MAGEKKYKWVRIAESVQDIPFGENQLCEADVNGKYYCLAMIKDELFACTHKCPHAGGFMADGFIDALGHIVCPLHRYRYDLKNGRNVSGEGYYLKTYPIRVDESGVYIGMEEKGLFGWLK